MIISKIIDVIIKITHLMAETTTKTKNKITILEIIEIVIISKTVMVTLEIIDLIIKEIIMVATISFLITLMETVIIEITLVKTMIQIRNKILKEIISEEMIITKTLEIMDSQKITLDKWMKEKLIKKLMIF